MPTEDKIRDRIAEIEGLLFLIDQLRLWDEQETKIDALLEELEELKEQLK